MSAPDHAEAGVETLFDRVGGRPFFDALVSRFYARVSEDALLRPMYPDDLGPSVTNTAGFLAQFWGGGTVQYSDHRGHPRLRARHMPFPITRAERDRWYRHMADSVLESDADDATKAEMLEYFDRAATFLINSEP